MAVDGRSTFAEGDMCRGEGARKGLDVVCLSAIIELMWLSYSSPSR